MFYLRKEILFSFAKDNSHSSLKVLLQDIQYIFADLFSRLLS